MIWVLSIVATSLVVAGLLYLWSVSRRNFHQQGEYLAESGLSDKSLLRASVNGVRWDRAPIPWRFHHCWVQTRYYSRNSTKMGRCACGAFTRSGRSWTGRNSRRRGLHRR